MKEDLIADIWDLLVEHTPEKQRKDLANSFVDVLMDHGVSASTLDNLLGIDPYLDQAIDYAIDDEDIENDEEGDEYDDYED